MRGPGLRKRPGLRLRRRGTALLVAGAVAVAAGEADAIAALVAAGAGALALVVLAATGAAVDGRRMAGRLVPQLRYAPRQVEPGETVELQLGAASTGAASTGPGRWGRAGGAVRRPRHGTGPGWLEVDDPSGRWLLRRRHGVVAATPVPARPTGDTGPSGRAGPPRRAGRAGRAGVTLDDAASCTRLLVAPARGALEIGPLVLWHADPFGIAEVAVGRAGPWQVLVVAPPTAGAGSSRPAGIVGNRHAAAGPGSVDGELLELQPLRGPVAAGPVHWPTTLRTGTPVVRRFAAPAGQGAWVHLDLRPACHTPATLEAAVAATGGLVAAELVRGRQVLLTGTGQPPARIEPGPGSLPVLAAWLALADLDPSGGREPSGRAGTRPGTVVTTAAGAGSWAATVDVLVVGPGHGS